MSLVAAAAVFTETVHARELPIEPFVYGIVAISIFFALGIVTYTYRDVANRHRAKAEAYAKRHGGEHGGH